jgi:hypothetical protein
VFDMYMEEYAVHRVLSQFGLYQESPLPVVHTILTPPIGEFSSIYKFNSAFEDFSHCQICLIYGRWSWRGVSGLVTWVQRVQSYVDGWATATQDVITERTGPMTTRRGRRTSSGTPQGLRRV